MLFNELILLFEFKHAYEKIIGEKAKKEKLDEDEEIKKSLKELQRTLAMISLKSENTEKLMTKEELEKFYDEYYEKHIKQTNQISLIQIEVADEKIQKK